jgi:signal transduction histidine kinase/DNA-binding NarL/FixJ family response regulator
MKFSEDYGVVFAYYWRYTGGGKGQFIVDNDTDPETQVTPDDFFSLENDISMQALETRDIAVSDLGAYSKNWNGLLSATIPVFDGSGEIAAFAGVDVYDESILAQRRASLIFIILLCTTLASSFFSAIFGIWTLNKRAKQSEWLNQTKTKFLATVSHEIRTPLNAIIGLSQIQLKKDIPQDTQSVFDKILQSGATLLNIVNDMLDISKIESGNLDLLPVEYDVPSLINDTVQLNIVRIGSKPIVFELEIDETIPVYLFGDELRIKQIMNNLLSNAFKYTRKGTVKLAFGWEKIAQDDIFFIITVSDTGIGIKKEDTRKLFSEYTQFDKIANRKIEGTGLGLSITKQLVHMMNGTITAESEYGKGSVFAVKIIQKAVSFNPIGKETVENLKSSRYYDSKRDMTKNLKRAYMPYASALVVDDVPTNLDVARGLLEPYGMNVESVLSGQEAIDRIGKGIIYDIIFMDHMMPEMDGIEAVRVIRNVIGTEYAKNVPIIALTANAIVGNEQMFAQNGFSGFISKPIDILALDAALNKFVCARQSKETLDAAEKSRPGAQPEQPEIPNPDESPFIEGLDMRAGIERFAGADSYFKILETYAKSTPRLLDTLKKLSPETLGEYTIAVHGLKSASYGVFASDTGKRAEELEALAKAGNYDEAGKRNADFIAGVQRLLDNINARLNTRAKTKIEKTIREKIDYGLLKKLLDANDKFDIASLEQTLEEIEKYAYSDAKDAELAAFLRVQIDELEYDKIHQTLEKLL